ncbi:uncharacterized protein EI90DRAFT_828406 [Cantharellus anzutake]|uniref:uncharacterized protein n=1 Tax=Cantharellus anzutake TaxID=1750568 RepID=UPI001906BB58|nr:uncharacterized protein EI90DRAFT_828406 [Cantharellus anzutake]KAF8343089.1 hypothetical protein EI90DRAFT_828406 [Cantharellus anzutake]
MARQPSDADRSRPGDTITDHDAEYRENAKGSKPLKAKDLSHVPCKFHRQGACTAGASCPFSHIAAEPGQQKGICQWYIKGNCKFAHKCALAHVLPGQPLSMDRKNKRAEQQARAAEAAAAAVAAASSTDPETSAQEVKRADTNEKRYASKATGDSLSSIHSGSTLGLRGSASSRPPMMIGKATATVSTSQMESPLHDTHLSRPGEETRRSSLASTSFAAVASAGLTRTSNLTQQLENSGLGPAASNSPSNNTLEEPHSPVPVRYPSATVASLENNANVSPERRRSPIPESQTRPNARAVASDLGFGPIGSPPQSSSLSARLNYPGSPQAQAHSPPGGISLTRGRHLNGLSPATPPKTNAFNFDPSAPGGFSTSPFSPGSASLYVPFGGSVPSRPIAPLTSIEPESSGSRGLWGEATHRGSLPASALLATMSANDVAVSNQVMVDDDAEEFLPHDLLSDEEKVHREVRGRAGSRPHFGDSQPRFVSSVPATGLLGQLHAGGLWNEKTERPEDATPQYLNGGRNPPASRNNDFVAVGGGNAPSPSLLGTSNASAAFLSAHLHRSNGGTQDIYPYGLNVNQSENRDALPHTAVDFAMSPPRASMLSNTKSSGLYYPNDGYLSSQQAARPLDSGLSHGQMALSPSSRALRSHEPGQSLPQGLAAGLSRLHLVPAANLVSPPLMSGSMTGSPREGLAQQDDWLKSISTELRSPPGGTGGSVGSTGVLSPPRLSALHNAFGGQGAGGSAGIGQLNGGIEATFGYSGVPAAAAHGMQHPWGTHNVPSPLSRTVHTGHDDTLFEMDDA